VVQSLIDSGEFVPHSLGTCDQPGREWDAFVRAFPIDDGIGPRLRAACCADMGCDGLNVNVSGFGLCMPGPQTWDAGGTVGAIGFGPAQWSPECDELTPYAFAHDYDMVFSCQGVSCLDFREECGCSCDQGSCSALQNQLETDYGVLEEVWELACTGYPWVWDRFAFGDGGWVGDSCQFNQPDPEPGTIPDPFTE